MPSLAWCPIGEIATQQGLTTGQSLATARVVVRFDALKQQEAHNASMGSQVKFREGSGASMVEDLVAAFAVLAGFCAAACATGASLLRGRLGPEHGGRSPEQWPGPMPTPGGRTCRRPWKRIGREATSFCCRKILPLLCTLPFLCFLPLLS